MRFAPDGRTLAVGTGDGNRSEVHLVDVATRRARRIGAWPGAGGPATAFPKFSLAFAPDGRRLAVALANWDADTYGAGGPALRCSSTPAPDARCGGAAIRSGAARWRPTSCSAATAR